MVGALRKELPPELLLTNRQGTAKALTEWVTGNPGLLAIRAPSPQEMVDVFTAWVHTLSPEQADAVASRTIIVNDAVTLQALATSKERLILIAGPRLETTQELFAEVRRQGHHLLQFATFTEPKGSDIVEMERMRLHDLKEALQKAGIEEREAAQLAESAGGSFTVLRRRFAGGVGITRPEWADGVEAQDLASLLLAAAWNQNNAEDCKVVEKLTGKPYSEVEKLAVRLLLVADPPLRRILKTWEFVSPQDAWTLLYSTLTSSLVNAFESVIVDVLGENDPALDLPPEKRFLAPMQGKRLKFSEPLRRGLAEILALSAGLASEGLITDDHNFIGRARRIVCRLLPTGSDWKRWASIGDLLPLLAEAAPEEFLNVVAQDLKSPNPALVELMRQEYGDAITGAIYHRGLLWAMEALAWPTRYTATVADLLTKLATLDPGGRWGNRPSASLKNLFFSWRPQTLATLDELLVLLRRLTEKQPEATWKLLVGLFPKHHSSITDSNKPSPWRTWAAGWIGEVVAEDYFRYISGIVDLAVNSANAEHSRWPELLDRCTALFPADRSRIFAALEKISPVSSVLLFEALEAMLGADKEDWRALETYYVQQMIKRLQADGEADESRLARLEFGFLFILGPQTDCAETLERMLARHPKLFVDCLKLLYGPRHGVEEEEPKQPDPHDAQRANLIRGLLRDWQRIPGAQPDGSISASELRDWVTAARTAAREADRLEVCDIEIGEVFARAPSDDEGVKPCVPIREVIEVLESNEIDRGFENGLLNLRGAFWRGRYDGGEQERELAATYERYAKACEMAWPRTATILRSVAHTYFRDAERADAEALMRK